jgi:hypothetical protein
MNCHLSKPPSSLNIATQHRHLTTQESKEHHTSSCINKKILARFFYLSRVSLKIN